MLAVRIIPCLDVREGRVVKGIRFKDMRDAGDPEEHAAIYEDQGADEICFLDVGASPEMRSTAVEVVDKVSRRVFVPLTAGGGVRDVEDVRRLLQAGADKVSIGSAALRRPELLREAARRFGSQCVVLSIDAARKGRSWSAWLDGGRTDSGVDALDWAVRAEDLGAGEILLNSIDRDGTKEGYDLELVRAVTSRISLPVIASGGAGTTEHVLEVVREAGASAVLLASLFHERSLTIADLKRKLKEKGVFVRW